MQCSRLSLAGLLTALTQVGEWFLLLIHVSLCAATSVSSWQSQFKCFLPSSVLIFGKAFLNFYFYSTCPLHPLFLDEKTAVEEIFLFCFYPGNFSSVTESAAPQSGWYREEMLKLELELDQAAGELLDPALLPEKCLCNYTINMVFMPTLYKTY